MHPLTRAAVTAAAAGLLLWDGGGHRVLADSHAASIDEAENYTSYRNGLSLVLVDNSGADSWLEVDRTGNSSRGSGSAGSDHDGHAVGGGQVVEQS